VSVSSWKGVLNWLDLFILPPMGDWIMGGRQVAGLKLESSCRLIRESS